MCFLFFQEMLLVHITENTYHHVSNGHLASHQGVCSLRIVHDLLLSPISRQGRVHAMWLRVGFKVESKNSNLFFYNATIALPSLSICTPTVSHSILPLNNRVSRVLRSSPTSNFSIWNRKRPSLAVVPPITKILFPEITVVPYSAYRVTTRQLVPSII